MFTDDELRLLLKLCDYTFYKALGMERGAVAIDSRDLPAIDKLMDKLQSILKRGEQPC